MTLEDIETLTQMDKERQRDKERKRGDMILFGSNIEQQTDMKMIMGIPLNM